MIKYFCKAVIFFYSIICFDLAAQSPLKLRDTSIPGPQTFAIVMGISKYKYVKPLAYADKDAILFSDYLQSPAGGTVKKDNIFMLLNEKATNANFWTKGFQWLKAKQLQKGDRLFVYLAGHGDAIDENQFFFLGYNCNPAGDKNNYLVAGAVQLFNLKLKIAAETAKGVDVFFIMDACRSNELPGGKTGQNFLNAAISEKKAGEIIMLATGAGQESLEDISIGNGHGLFTWYLVDGLNGTADKSGTPDNKISYQEIKTYIDNNVPSIAQQQFNRKQHPYFCCTENNEKIISTVDTAYLRKWLQTKKQQQRGPGNSFSGNINKTYHFEKADTLLVETYNQFNIAIQQNKITGKSSAEEFYNQLTIKFPGNPYTLDAKSTLAVEYINFAQDKVDQYLTCSDKISTIQKQENTDAAARLEKAIAYVREDDAEFANSLLGRMYLLKASSNNISTTIALQNAYAALAIDPGGAYIQNKLALLHLENNNNDSAIYYAEKATATAPGWLCAFNTLALVRNAPNSLNQDKNIPENIIKPKNSFGGLLATGLSQMNPTYTEAQNTNIIGINSRDNIKFEIGIFYQVNISKNISIRPATILLIDGGELIYQRRDISGGPITEENIKFKNSSISLTLPFVFRLSEKNMSPFISLGPAYNYIINQDANTSKLVPIKKSALLGDIGFGTDFGLGKSKLVLTPELKYTQGFNSQKENTRNEYTNTLSTLKKRGFTFSLYLRGN